MCGDTLQGLIPIIPIPVPHIACIACIAYDGNATGTSYRQTHTDDAGITASTVTGYHRDAGIPLLGILPRRIPLSAVRRIPHRRRPRRHLRPPHRHPVRQHQGYYIKHIVVRPEAHDSGLCVTDPAAKDEFAFDLTNLTLASPSANRHQKADKDATEWLPELNRCWYAERVVLVPLEYRHTTDRAKVDINETVLTSYAQQR